MNCSQLYIGTDVQIPESKSEAFSVEEPFDAEEGINIQKVLGTKHVYYLAPHTGCGCGWDFLNVGTPNDEMSKQSCECLAGFFSVLRASGIEVKVYSVCSESVGVAPSLEEQLSAAEFLANLSKYRVPYASSVVKVYRLCT